MCVTVAAARRQQKTVPRAAIAAAPPQPSSRPFKSSSEPSVVAASVYAGGRLVKDISIDEAGEWSKRDGHVVWIGLFEPSQEILRRIQVQLGLHPLAIEDAAKPHQQPKLEQYGKALFIVARTAQLAGDGISFGETHIFLGKGYVVSVRHGASTSYALVRPSSRTARTTSFMPFSTSSSTITCPSLRRFKGKSTISKTAF